MQEVELHAVFRGEVQGVGFRYSAQHWAERHGVRGSVRNLPDGAVKLIAQGDKPVLEAFIEALKETRGRCFVDHVDVHYSTPQQPLEGFRIVH